ncbi:hypothetical protein B0H10DRAFT_1948452, partial [Mycena sp. CBHHK59/15]
MAVVFNYNIRASGGIGPPPRPLVITWKSCQPIFRTITLVYTFSVPEGHGNHWPSYFLTSDFPALLKALKKRIPSLPGSLPLWDAEGPLARYLGNLEVDVEEGEAFSANRKWEHAFQASEEEQRKQIGCTKYEGESIKLVVDSNFHSHVPKCVGMPPVASFEAFTEAEAVDKAGTRLVLVTGMLSIVLQCQTLSKYIQEGIENPAVVVTKRGFHKSLIKGIALDDLGFSFPERKGMNVLLKYLLPRGWKLKTILEHLFKFYKEEFGENQPNNHPPLCPSLPRPLLRRGSSAVQSLGQPLVVQRSKDADRVR